MTILRSALLVLLATIAVACNSAESKAAQDTADAQRALAGNQSTPAPLPATTATVADGQPVSPMGATILAFHKHLEAYMKVHNEAEGKVPNLKRTDDPVEISTREKALAEMIMTLRAGAQEGVVFAPDVQKHFRRSCRRISPSAAAPIAGPSGTSCRRARRSSVNTIYPTTLPLLTFPAALLQKLPDLPPELEYRIVGRHLILRDVKANLIVDVLRDAIPTTYVIDARR